MGIAFLGVGRHVFDAWPALKCRLESHYCTVQELRRSVGCIPDSNVY